MGCDGGDADDDVPPSQTLDDVLAARLSQASEWVATASSSTSPWDGAVTGYGQLPAAGSHGAGGEEEAMRRREQAAGVRQARARLTAAKQKAAALIARLGGPGAAPTYAA